MSLRDDLVAAMQVTAARKPRPVKTKQWGTVYVRDVTVAEVDLRDDEEEKKTKNQLARGAARVLCDENGKLLFDENNEADVALLAKQPWPLLRKVLQDNDSGN